MSQSSYEILLRIGGALSPSLNSSFSNVSRSMQGMDRTAQTSNKSFLGMGEGIGKLAKAAVGLAGAYMGFNAIKNFGSESVTAAKAQIDAETKLGAVLKNVHSIQAKGPEAYKAAKNELLGVASNLQKVGVIGDEVSLSGMQQLATFQLNSKQIGTLSSGMGDLLAQQKGLNATQGDAVNIANMIGKAMDGQTGALSRVGISFTKAQGEAIKTGNATQRAAVIAQVLKQNVGGVNKALADTDQGKIKQMNNAWGDMKEQIGMKILPIQAKLAGSLSKLIPVIEKIGTGIMNNISPAFDYLLNPVIPSVSKAITGLMPTFKTIGNIVKNDIFPVIKNLFKFTSEHGEATKNIVLGIVAAFVGFRVVTGIIGGVRKATEIWQGVTKAMAIAQTALNLVLDANPIALVALGIAALVAGGVALYMNWDKVSKGLSATWVNIKNSFIEGINGAIGMIDKFIGTLNKIPGVNIPLLSKIGLDVSGNSSAAGMKAVRMAKGGIVKRRSGGIMANIGEGNYDEAVVPLKPGGGIGGGGDNFTYSPVYHIGSGASVQEFKQAASEAQREWEMRMSAWRRNNKRVSFA